MTITYPIALMFMIWMAGFIYLVVTGHDGAAMGLLAVTAAALIILAMVVTP